MGCKSKITLGITPQPALPFTPSSVCLVYKVEGSEEGELRAVWGSPRRRQGVRISPQPVAALHGRTGGGMMRSLLLLVPFPLLHLSDDPRRQGLIISELLLLFLASPL